MAVEYSARTFEMAGEKKERTQLELTNGCHSIILEHAQKGCDKQWEVTREKKV